MKLGWRPQSLAGQLLALQVVIVLAVGSVALVLAVRQARQAQVDDSRRLVSALAQLEAKKATTIDALLDPSPRTQREVQLAAQDSRFATRTDFVIVMRPDGEQLSAPDPGQIGRRYAGQFAPAAAGALVSETYEGPQGASIRAVAPVREKGFGGRIIGMVAIGISQDRISAQVAGDVRRLLVAAALSIGLMGAGAVALSRRLHRQTLGLGPVELARMYEYWDAVLHSVREGLVVLDRTGRVQMMNDEAHALIGVRRTDWDGSPDDPEVPSTVAEAWRSGRVVEDELWVVADHVLAVNQRPALWQGRVLGSVMTLRDQHELAELSEQLSSSRAFADSLHNQMHDAANKLHTVITLAELGRIDEAVELATAELHTSRQLTDRILGSVREPTVAALLLGQVSTAASRGVDLSIADGTELDHMPLPTGDLVRLLGNLVDNAIEAAAAAPPPREVVVLLREQTGDDGRPEVLLSVSDSGPGLDPADLEQATVRGWSTKVGDAGPRGIGLALVAQVLRRHHGTLVTRPSSLGGAEIVATFRPHREGGASSPAPPPRSGALP